MLVWLDSFEVFAPSPLDPSPLRLESLTVAEPARTPVPGEFRKPARAKPATAPYRSRRPRAPRQVAEAPATGGVRR